MIAVLWIVAALSIAVTGMVRSQRNEIRTVSVNRQMLQATAMGQAAINLALQKLASGSQPLVRVSQATYSFNGQLIPVEMAPLNGLIDPNRAPQALLVALLRLAGGLDAVRAEATAEAIINARSAAKEAGQAMAFEALEDLLRVPGIGYELYARLAPLMTTDGVAAGLVNPLAAPREVLLVLAGGDHAEASRVESNRLAAQLEVETTRLNAGFVAIAPSNRLRLQAWVPLEGGGKVAVRRDIQLTLGAGNGLPWRVLQSSERFSPAPTEVRQ